MHNKNQNKKTVAFVNIEDLNRDPEGVAAAIKAYEEEERVPYSYSSFNELRVTVRLSGGRPDGLLRRL